MNAKHGRNGLGWAGSKGELMDFREHWNSKQMEHWCVTASVVWIHPSGAVPRLPKVPAFQGRSKRQSASQPHPGELCCRRQREQSACVQSHLMPTHSWACSDFQAFNLGCFRVVGKMEIYFSGLKHREVIPAQSTRSTTFRKREHPLNKAADIPSVVAALCSSAAHRAEESAIHVPIQACPNAVPQQTKIASLV